MEPDEALLEAWTLDEHCDNWPCPYEIERYDQLLPTLIEAGYAETSEVGDPPIQVWTSTPEQIGRFSSKTDSRSSAVILEHWPSREVRRLAPG